MRDHAKLATELRLLHDRWSHGGGLDAAEATFLLLAAANRLDELVRDLAELRRIVQLQARQLSGLTQIEDG